MVLRMVPGSVRELSMSKLGNHGMCERPEVNDKLRIRRNVLQIPSKLARYMYAVLCFYVEKQEFELEHTGPTAESLGIFT